VCTVLLRLDRGAPWPVILGAIRDEFVERAWDPPARHWTGAWSRYVGGRDRTAGGTWLAVDPSVERPAVAAVLNGKPRDPLPGGATRPTRGELVLRLLAGDGVPTGDDLALYDRFHLVLATAGRSELWSWDGEVLDHQRLTGPHHLVVNAGLDAPDDPMVPLFAPLLAAVADPGVDDAWGGWPELLTGGGLPGDDERALVVAKEIEGHPYGSTSAALVGISADGRVRYDFTATPADPTSWVPIVAPG
jgi:uncharacterized protein with NRDE domain